MNCCFLKVKFCDKYTRHSEVMRQTLDAMRVALISKGQNQHVSVQLKSHLWSSVILVVQY